MNAKRIGSIRHCRLWMLGIVVIVLVIASSGIGLVTPSQVRGASTQLSALLNIERGLDHAP